jgi:hypothetical protein
MLHIIQTLTTDQNISMWHITLPPEHIQQGNVSVIYVPSEENLAHVCSLGMTVTARGSWEESEM